MRILVTNDDGIKAAGLYELARALKEAGHEVFIVAPDCDQSCISHSLTLRRPLYAEKCALKGLDPIPAYSVNGTPCDCVRLAVGNLGAEPELIVSGINQAPNLGTDAVYSGTVSAALEGYMIGIPSIAVSKDTFSDEHMADAARYFSHLLPKLTAYFSGCPGMLNVNFPSCSEHEYRGIKVAKTAFQRYPLAFTEQIDEAGRTAYCVRSDKLTECSDQDDTDELYIRKGYVVITPLTWDITDHLNIKRAKGFFETVGGAKLE